MKGLYSQDTLFQNSGERLAVKVAEVNPTLIKYHRIDNLTGPLYSVKINEVRYIKYAGGQIDSFQVAETPKIVVKTPEPKNELVYSGSKLYYNDNSIDEKQLLNIINTFPDEKARKRMQHNYRQMIGHRDISSASLACGLALGCVVVVATAPFVTGLTVGFAIPTEEGMQVALVGILSGAAMRITGFAVSQSQRNKKKAKLREIVSVYNEDFNFK